jgi:hypothetical protein
VSGEGVVMPTRLARLSELGKPATIARSIAQTTDVGARSS